VKVATTTRRRETDVPARLRALDEAIGLGEGRLDAMLIDEARVVRAKAGERLARGAQAVVVALGGGTGSGKSSLFNALAGAPLAEVGVVRPVTSDVRAWVVGDPQAAAPVLDWLGVARRHLVDPTPEAPEGLVLLDLPDHDSVALGHREVVDRYVERVDVLTWVVDPLKYAQRALHAGYLRRLAEHADVLFVVLNRVDELDRRSCRACLDDLRRILAGEGLGGARVLATSAATGEGVDELRRALADEVRSRRAIGERIAADVRTVAAALAAQTGPPARTRLDGAALVGALAGAAGLDAIAAGAAAGYSSRARTATRPLVSRGVWTIVTLPLRSVRWLRPPRVHRPAGRAAPTGATVSASAPAPAAVRHALLELADSSSRGLAPRWSVRLRSVASGLGEGLPRAAAKAIDTVPLAAPRRSWWRPLAWLWSLVELVATVGLVWLVVLGVLAWLQLPPPPVPDAVGELPWPTALLGGGTIAWLIVGWVRNRAVAVGAARHRRHVAAELRSALAASVEEHALRPLGEELEAQRALADALHAAGG